MNSREVLAMNFKYYRYQYNLSQEDFAEVIESNLAYVNQIENLNRKPSIDMLDKIANNMNKNLDNRLQMTSFELLRYDARHKTNFTRIDERK